MRIIDFFVTAAVCYIYIITIAQYNVICRQFQSVAIIELIYKTIHNKTSKFK